MRMPISFGTLVLVAVLSPLRPGVAQTPACPEDPLNQRVPIFEAKNASTFDVILTLGHQTGISMGLIGWETALFDKRVDLQLTNATVGGVLRNVLAPLGGVDLNGRGGEIVISLADVAEPQWLGEQLVGFLGGPTPLQSASRGLSMWLRKIEDPSITGFAGTSRPGDANDLVGPFVEEETTVREILSRMVCTSSEGALWIAHETPSTEYFVSGQGQSYWTVLGYSEDLEVNLRIAERRRDQLRQREAQAK